MYSNPIVSDPQEETEPDPVVAQIMARELRRLCRERGLTRDDIRAALPDLTLTEFAALWAGTRTVYVNEAMALTYVFEPDPTEWIYVKTMFDAISAHHAGNN